MVEHMNGWVLWAVAVAGAIAWMRVAALLVA